MMTDIEDTLQGREDTYGPFPGHAAISQALKLEMHSEDSWEGLNDDMKEALDMIQHKIARIMNGDPTVTDSWHDIAGYARLVERRLLSDAARAR